MPPDLALLSTLIGSNYPCLKLIFMVPQVFEPLKFNCICTMFHAIISKGFRVTEQTRKHDGRTDRQRDKVITTGPPDFIWRGPKMGLRGKPHKLICHHIQSFCSKQTPVFLYEQKANVPQTFLNTEFFLKYEIRKLLRHEKIPETHVLATLLTGNARLFNVTRPVTGTG